MTSTESTPAPELRLREWDEDVVASRRRFRRRVPAPRANPFWRFLFPLVVVGLGVITFDLWREGTKAVLDSTDGTIVEVPSDPSAPGYEAFAVPTPTMMILHVDDNDELVGVTVMARTLLDNGGQIVLLSSDLAANGLGGVTLAGRYATEGADAVEHAVGAMFGFGFTDTATYNTSDFGSLLALAEPLPFSLLDDLFVTTPSGDTDLFLGAGNRQLDGAVAAELYAFRNPNEADANRNERQADLWESWMVQVGRALDTDAVVPPFDDGLSAYLRAFGAGQRDIELAPAVPAANGDGTPIYVFDDDGWALLDEISDRMTPLPIAPRGSDMPTIRLLDGTGDRRIAQAALDTLSDLAEVAIVGNAIEFGVTRTSVSYHQEAVADAAQRLAGLIGGEVFFDPRPDDPAELTVVIGTDWEAP